MQTTKICSKCGETKELELFTKNNECKSGRSNQCKKCTNEYKIYWLKKLRKPEKEKTFLDKLICEYIRKQKKKIYAKKSNEKNKEKIAKSRKIYRDNNKEKIKQKKKTWRKNNPEICREAGRRFKRLNKHTERFKLKAINYYHKRESLKNNNKSDITIEWLLELKLQTTHCEITGVELNEIRHHPNSRHLDHIIPLNVGGTHTKDNVRYISAKANLERPKDGRDLIGTQYEEKYQQILNKNITDDMID